jgi:hypothetical protein
VAGSFEKSFEYFGLKEHKRLVGISPLDERLLSSEE